MFCLFIDTAEGLNKEEVDLSIDAREAIAITRQLNNVANILDPRSNFAKNIALMGTPRTIKALGFRHRTDLTEEAREKLIGRKYTAILEYNTLNMLEGEAVLEIRNIRTDHNTSLPVFDAFLTGTRYNWSSLLSEMTVHSLHSHFPTFTRDDTTARNTWDKGVYPDTYIGCVYYPFYYGAWLNHNNVHLWDLRGHIYFMYLLEKALESIGWEVIGSWKDWEETRGLTIPFTAETIKPGTDEETAASLDLPNTFVAQQYKDGDRLRAENPIVDANPTASIIHENWKDGVFRIPAYGKYTLQWFLTGTNTIPGSYYRLVIESKLKGVLADTVLTGGPGGVGSGIETQRYYQAGDEISFTLVNDPSGDPNNRYDVLGTSGSVIMNYDADYTTWPTSVSGMNATHNLPRETTVGELLEGVAHFYGLHAITNGVAKTVEFIPARTFYNLAVGEDITRYIDFTEPIEELPPLDHCDNILMKWKDANDKLAQEIESYVGPLYGDKVPEDQIEQCYDLRENPTFYPTFYISGADPASTDYNVPAIRVKDEFYDPGAGHALYDYLDHDIGLRILFYDGKQNNDPNPPPLYVHNFQTLTYDDAAGGGPVVLPIAPLPYAYMVDGWRAYNQNLDQHHNFGNGQSVYLGYATKNIWSSQYTTAEKINEMRGSKDHWYRDLITIQLNRRRFKAFVKITPVKFLQWNFRNLKYVNTGLLGMGRYVLSSINDYNPELESARIELLLHNEPSGNCPRSLEEVGLVIHLIDTPTQVWGITVEITNQDDVKDNYLGIYGQSVFVDNDPNAIPGAWAVPGSNGDNDYNFDVYPFAGGVFSPIDKIVAGQTQRRIRFVGTFAIEYNGTLCTISYCYNLIYDSGGVLIEETLKEICPDAVLAPPELSAACCFDNFVEISDWSTVPPIFPAALAEDRFYTLMEFTVNGVNVKPGAIGQVSPTFGDIGGTVDYLDCLGYGYPTCTSVLSGLLANNFDNLLAWLNGLGLEYLNFVPSQQHRCIEYAPGIPFTIEIERDIAGATNLYRVEYDGVNDPIYYINGGAYSNYTLACFDSSEAAPQAIVNVTQINEQTIEINFLDSIAADGTVAGTRGEHTYSIRAAEWDGTPIAGTEVTFTSKDPSDTLSGADISALEAALGVQAVSGTYGVITIILGAVDPGAFLPGGHNEVGDIQIYDHTFVESLQSDTNPGPETAYALIMGTFDQQCYADDTDYPVFTNADVGGIEEIHNPGGVGLLLAEIGGILLRYDGTFFVADDYPQAPDVAKWFEVDYGDGNGFVPTQSIHTLQGPYTPGSYATTGFIGDMRTAWLAEFGTTLQFDTIYDFRLLQAGVSHLGLHFRAYSKFRNLGLPQRLKIRLNDDLTTYFIFQINYPEILSWGSVYFVPDGGGGGGGA